MRLRLMAVSSAIILAGCVPRAVSDYRFDSYPAPPAAKGPQILTEQGLVVETPSWSPASVERNARRVVTSIYQVQSGDSLFSIANKTGGGATTIANANKLMPPYTLQLGHLGRLDVTKGYRVPLGQPIGGVDETGYVSQLKLHFQLRKNRQAVNPLSYLEPING